MNRYLLQVWLDRLPVTDSGCKVWDRGLDKDGYPSTQVHRQILSQKLGRRIKKGYMCLHTCDNPSCVAADHLWEGTHQDNMDDMVQKGRSNGNKGVHLIGINRKGSNHPGTSLNELQVKQIRKLYSTGEYSYKELGFRFGLRPANVSQIVNRKTWRHI